MKCSSCGGPYHEASGHRFSDKTRLCGVCAKDFQKWLKMQMSRRSGGLKFYDYAYPPKDIDMKEDDKLTINDDKHPAIEAMLRTIFPNRGTGCCATCGSEKISSKDFSDDTSRKEFGISGMCQACQDSFFSENQEEDLNDDEPAF